MIEMPLDPTEVYFTWLENARTFHHRMMANYLKKRGWVAFYLEKQTRTCDKDCCWLELYEYEESKKA